VSLAEEDSQKQDDLLIDTQGDVGLDRVEIDVMHDLLIEAQGDKGLDRVELEQAFGFLANPSGFSASTCGKLKFADLGSIEDLYDWSSSGVPAVGILLEVDLGKQEADRRRAARKQAKVSRRKKKASALASATGTDIIFKEQVPSSFKPPKVQKTGFAALQDEEEEESPEETAQEARVSEHFEARVDDAWRLLATFGDKPSREARCHARTVIEEYHSKWARDR
jgi:hypothetical protein